ncbi:MAG: hypothetical protein KDK12_10860 [Rhodobacteraceae bacterium]|nr:hypothetical protein [Paracoccaceae bacterium]
MFTYRLSVKDAAGRHLPNFRVCIVSSSGTHPWPLPWTDVPDNRAITLAPDLGIPGNRMYLEGPGNLRQPTIINWRSGLNIKTTQSHWVDVWILDCDDMVCASCAEAGRWQAAQAKAADSETFPDLDNREVVYRHDYDCIEVTLRAVDAAGQPVTGYLGRVKHHEPGPWLTEMVDLGLGKTLKIRKADHHLWLFAWKAGSDPATAKTMRFTATQSQIVEVPIV